MGAAKRAMMEAEDYVMEETCITFSCPQCTQLSEGFAEIPLVDQSLLGEVETPISVECCECAESFDAIFTLSHSICSVVLEDFPTTEVDFESLYFSSSYEEQDWLAEQAQLEFEEWEKSYPTFLRAYNEVLKFLREYGSDAGDDAMNRMIFSQCFSMYEAYLGDAYLNIVFRSDDNRRKFLGRKPDTQKLSVSVSDLISYGKKTADQIVRIKVVEVVRGISFHNLRQSMGLYKVYDIKMFEDESVKVQLLKAVQNRHHCVHRNGCDLEGVRLNVYTKSYVLEIAEAMKSSVTFIQSSLDRLAIDG